MFSHCYLTISKIARVSLPLKFYFMQIVWLIRLIRLVYLQNRSYHMKLTQNINYLFRHKINKYQNSLFICSSSVILGVLMPIALSGKLYYASISVSSIILMEIGDKLHIFCMVMKLVINSISYQNVGYFCLVSGTIEKFLGNTVVVIVGIICLISWSAY